MASQCNCSKSELVILAINVWTGGRSMRWKIEFVWMPFIMFSLASAVEAQQGAKSPAAPKRDLTGVWMIRNPASMRAYAGATFTPEEPQLTPWAQAKYKEARNSNNGQYTLETTNDPVLTSCAPPGTPRVYFHPYPFEFVHTPKSTLMLYEYDHV